MKKKILCAAFLIFLTLTVCTMLAAEIEEEMTLEVIGWENVASFSTVDVPSSMWFYDDTGMHVYEVFEGTGWESGWRAREVETKYGNFIADRLYMIVRGASRQPVYGELAKLYEGKDTAPATYLAVYPGGIPEENDQLFQAEILESSETALLLYVEDGVQPFTENRAKSGLVQLSAGSWKIYSMEALTEFLENIPTAALIAVLVWAIGVFAVQILLLWCRPEGKGKRIFLNTAVLLVCLAGLSRALEVLDLPASMLPSAYIFDFEHYRTLLDTIFQGLSALSAETLEIYGNLRTKVLCQSAAILAVGILLPILTVSLQTVPWPVRQIPQKSKK